MTRRTFLRRVAIGGSAALWLPASVLSRPRIAQATTVASTDFAGPPENPLSEGGNWTALTSIYTYDPVGTPTVACQKAGGECKGTQPASTSPTGYSHNWMRYGASLPSDQWAEIVPSFIADGGNDWPGVGVRCQVSGPQQDSQYLWEPILSTFYRIDADGSTFTVTPITTDFWGDEQCVAGDRLRIMARGTEIRCYKNGGLIARCASDAMYQGGQPTIYCHCDSDVNGLRLSSFRCGNFTGAADSTTFSGPNEQPLWEDGRWIGTVPIWSDGGVELFTGVARAYSTMDSYTSCARITAPADQYAQVTIGAWIQGSLGPFVRIQRTGLTPINSGYVFACYATDPTISGICRVDNGALTRLTTVDMTGTQMGDVITMTIHGNGLRVYKNDTQIDAAVDGTYTNGDVGFWLSPELDVANTTISGWAGGAIPSAAWLSGRRRLS